MNYRTKDYQRLTDHRKYQTKFRNGVASLVVFNVSDQDTGLYTCEASNAHGYGSSTAALRIRAPPRIDVDDQHRDLSVHVGGTIRITANIEGEPAPKVSWYRNGERVANQNVDTTDFSSTLLVKRVTKEDSGEYKVVAKNEFGTTRVKTNVRVRGMYCTQLILLILPVNSNYFIPTLYV